MAKQARSQPLTINLGFTKIPVSSILALIVGFVTALGAFLTNVEKISNWYWSWMGYGEAALIIDAPVFLHRYDETPTFIAVSMVARKKRGVRLTECRPEFVSGERPGMIKNVNAIIASDIRNLESVVESEPLEFRLPNENMVELARQIKDGAEIDLFFRLRCKYVVSNEHRVDVERMADRVI